MLVTSQIKQRIFGLHTKLRFFKGERDHKNCHPKNFQSFDEVITAKYFQQNVKPLSSACVFVASNFDPSKQNEICSNQNGRKYKQFQK